MSDKQKNLFQITKSIYLISLSPYSDWKSKIYCNTFLSYLVNPDDVISDHLEDGFLDDTYIGLLILNDLIKYRKELLKRCIDNYESVEILVGSFLPEIEGKLKNKTDIIKQFSGYSSLEYFDLSNSRITPKTSVHLIEKAKLVGSIAFCYDILLRKNEKTSDLTQNFNVYPIEYLNRLTEIGDFFEVKRVIDCYKYKIKNIPSEDTDYDYRFFNYLSYIEKSIHNASYSEITSFLPAIFISLINIFKDKLCPWEIKHEINSALAYLIISEDVIDDRSDDGLIDDIFLLAFVISDIYNINKKIVINNLKNISIDNIIKIINKCEYILNTRVGLILNHLGFLSLIEFYELYNDSKCSIYKDNELYPIILRNNRLKCVLMDLMRLLFPDKLEKIRGGPSINNLLKRLDEIVTEMSGDNIDIYSKNELSSYIDLACKISYVNNLENELNIKEKEEIQLLRLRHRILETY